MTCREAVQDIVECARRGPHSKMDADLRAHLATCGACNDRWEAERQLTAQLGVIRKQAAALGSPASRRESRRELLMREFARVHAPLPMPARRLHYARWAMAAAAALVFAVVLGHQAGTRTRTTATLRAVATEPAVLYESNSLSSDASALSSDDFIAIPYTPPLAPGEMVRIIRTDIYPEALASMGVEVDPLAWSGRAADVPVEMVVGEDGIPRAVRITESSSFELSN